MVDTQNDPAEKIVYNNLKKFMNYRNIKSDYKFLSNDEFSNELNVSEYILIKGTSERHSSPYITSPTHDNNSPTNNTSKNSIFTYPIYIFLIKPNSHYMAKVEFFKSLIKKHVNVDKNPISEVIYITEQAITSYISKKITNEYNNIADKLDNPQRIYIYPYTYNYFIIALPECTSSIKHEIASNAEIDFMCNRLLIDPTNLPKIYNDDPQCVWIGAKPGDIVKISGYSETAQEFEEFRLCV
jgi:DNA-directed RNA polymerase subunit H